MKCSGADLKMTVTDSIAGVVIVKHLKTVPLDRENHFAWQSQFGAIIQVYE